MDVSVIIVNYNVRDFLESALHSVKKAMNGIEAEIFVVDNASQDGSAEMVRARFPDVHLITSSENLGFGKANNLAMKQSKGRYFLILNPDTIVQEDTLEKMVVFMDEHSDAGMAGCKVLNADGTFQLSCRRGFPTSWASFCKVFGLSSLFPHVKLFAGYNLTYLDVDKTYPVDALAGSFMMVRREVFEKTGGFDEDYFMYGEDIDWCYQTQKMGWKVYYAPVTQIIHYKGESAKRSSLDEVKVFYDAMHIFVRKNFSAPLIFILFLRCGIALRSFIALLLKNWRAVALMILDALIVLADVLISTRNRFGGFTALPDYAYPYAVLVPSLVVVCLLFAFGVYGRQWRSLRRTAFAVATSFFVISSLTFFFKQYAFSRQMVLEMTVMNIVLLSGFRVLLHIRSVANVTGTVRKAVIVGSPAQSLQLLKKLQQAGRGFDVVGFIDTSLDTIGELYEDVKVIGSTQTIAKVVEERRVSDVIFVADAVPYSEMLAAMNRCSGSPVAFRLVPGTADILVAKMGVDVLDELPVVALDYN
ncbi:MAG TPA: glycosyltransferase, partial [Candidatus Kapabacteria bacterium]|nr:glycosyltransferase [Candidatus Kapabacteria bacterium]